MNEWHVEEITDPTTGRVQRYEAATAEELDALIAADWPEDPPPPDAASVSDDQRPSGSD